MVLNPGDEEPAGSSKTAEKMETASGRVLRISRLPILHICCCIVLAVCMAELLDGYLAVSETASRTTGWGERRLRVSDITTIVQSALIVIRLLVSSWMGLIIWNCLFILLTSKDQSLTLAQISRMSSFYLPPAPKGLGSYQVILLLLLMIPQLLITPILTGAVGWSEAVERNPKLEHVKSGNQFVDTKAWYYYQTTLKNRRASVQRAAAYASMAWPDSRLDRRHCRHIMGSDSIPVNSTVLNATIPRLQIHGITFPNGPPSPEVIKTASAARNTTDNTMSCIEDGPLSYFGEGTAVLFDPRKVHPKYPLDNGKPVPPPKDFLQTGPMTSFVFIIGPSIDPQRKNCSNIAGNTFGLSPSPNIFSFQEAEGPFYRCYSHAVVNLTAGVATSPQSTYITSPVVEADVPDVDMDIRAGPWVQEAIYLLPDTMSLVRRMDTAALASWHDLPGYLDRLIRYSYQANWDMLSRSYDTDVRDLDVAVYESRLRASVSKTRVFAWLGISALLTASAVVLLLRDWTMEKKKTVTDRVLAALLTDPEKMLGDDREKLTSLSYLPGETNEKIGLLKLQNEMDKEGWKLIRSSPSR